MRSSKTRPSKPTPHHAGDQGARIRAILETTVDAIITIDAAGAIQEVNRAAVRMFGYQADEMIGRNISMLMPAPYAHEHDQYLRRYLRGGKPRIIGIGRVVQGCKKNGTVFPIDLAVSEVLLGNQRLFTGIVRDITERKRMEQTLHDERRFITAILDTVAALVVVLDTRGCIVRMNRSCVRTTGYELKTVQGKPYWNVFLPRGERAAAKRGFCEFCSGQGADQFESELATKQGEKRLIAWSNRVLTDEQGSIAYVISTGIDVTEQRRAEEAIVSVSEDVRREVGQDLHDVLGQQLTGILLLSKAVVRNLRDQSQAGAEEAASVAELARGALAEARRLAQGLYPMGIERLGLSAAFEELATTQQQIYHLNCTFEGDNNMPEVPDVKIVPLYRIGQEAVSNAVKHSRCRHVWLRLERTGSEVVLSIEDDGIGIPAAIPRGRGMGLEIMKYRARMIGGTLRVGPRKGGGTLARCTVPIGAG